MMLSITDEDAKVPRSSTDCVGCPAMAEPSWVSFLTLWVLL